MRRTTALAVVLTTLLYGSVGSLAIASPGLQLRLAFEGGALGELEHDFTFASGGAVHNESEEQGLTPTLGFALSLDAPVSHYVSVGPAIAVRGANTRERDDIGIGRDTLVDLGSVVRFGSNLDHSGVRLYLAIPIGLTLWVVSDDLSTAMGEVLEEKVEHDIGIGLHVGAVVGLQVDLSSYFAFFGELGWTYHHATLEASVGAVSLSSTYDAHQLAFNFGLAIGRTE